MSADIVSITAGSDRAQLRAFVGDDATRKVVDHVISDLMIPNASVHRGTIHDAASFLGQHRSPRYLIVDIAGSDLPLSDINQLAEVCEPGVTVIVIGDRNDVGLFRELINHGVNDYLVKPITASLLQKSLLGAVEGHNTSRQTSRLGKLVGVIGARGGVGATATAISVAWLIANDRKRRVALVDLDTQFGAIAAGLDLEPCQGMREALEDPKRIDPLYIDRSLARYSDSLAVLSAEEGLGERIAYNPEAINCLMVELTKQYHFVLVDIPRQISDSTLSVIGSCVNLLVLTDMSLIGMRDTCRLLQIIPGVNAACSVTVIANRVGEHRNGELDRREFEKGIGRPLDFVVPFDPRKAFLLTNEGLPLASQKNRVTAIHKKIADELCGLTSRRPRPWTSKLPFLSKIA